MRGRFVEESNALSPLWREWVIYIFLGNTMTPNYYILAITNYILAFSITKGFISTPLLDFYEPPVITREN